MDNEILLEVKPYYIEYVRFFGILSSPSVASLLIILLCFIPAGVPFVLLISELLQTSALLVSILLVIVIVTLLSLLFTIMLYLNKKNFEATTYKVYKDRVEFEEGYINHKYTSIRMEDVKEIHLLQNFIQRKAELGTIKFVTAANNSTSSTGVCFQDIKNSNAVYAKIKQIHENK